MMNNDTAAFGTRVQDSFDHPVERRVVDVVVSDGTRISVKLWLPEGSADTPTGVVPVEVRARNDAVLYQGDLAVVAGAITWLTVAP